MCKEQMAEIKSKNFPPDKYLLATKLEETYNSIKQSSEARISCAGL
jgi:hypothetical protein